MDFRWLFAAAKDRYLQALQKPQLFGVQTCFRTVKKVEVDAETGERAERSVREWWIPGGVEDWVTDEMRRQWGTTPLSRKQGVRRRSRERR